MNNKLRLLISGIIIVLAAVWLYIRSGPVEKIAKDYNILFISLDTTRTDFLGPYGNTAVSTPRLDALADAGVLFEHHYAAINTTLASHSSMFTGLYPRNHGVGRNRMRLSTKNLTLAEFLHSRGYTTAAFVGAFSLSSVFGIQQGFQVYDESDFGHPTAIPEKRIELSNSQGKSMEYYAELKRTGPHSRPAESVNKVFLKWLDQNRHKKFFAFVHYYDAHFPYAPPEKFYKKHLVSIPANTPMGMDEVPSTREWLKRIDLHAQFMPSRIDSIPADPSVQALVKLYLSEIEYCDFALGQILDVLRKDGLLSKTIIVVTADHGENLIDHSEFHWFFGHGQLTYDSEIHVPLIISAPGILPEGRRVREITSEIDLFPTLLDLIGHHTQLSFDGISLYPVLFKDRKTPSRFVFAEATEPFLDLEHGAGNLVWINDRNSGAVRSAQYKYMYAPWRKFQGIYDLNRDPAEEKNLLQDQSAIVKQLRVQLDRWRSKAMIGNVDTTFHLSEEDQEKLKSLGYTQ